MISDKKSIAALRNARGLNRFVYISCAPKFALANWLDFARPCSKSYKGMVTLYVFKLIQLNKYFTVGNPFVPTAAVGVDMFPYTHHCEMVILFERQPDIVDDLMNEPPQIPNEVTAETNETTTVNE